MSTENVQCAQIIAGRLLAMIEPGPSMHSLSQMTNAVLDLISSGDIVPGPAVVHAVEDEARRAVMTPLERLLTDKARGA